jgi:hypothetical protein
MIDLNCNLKSKNWMNLSLLNINQIGLNTFNRYASRYNGSSKCEIFEEQKTFLLLEILFHFNVLMQNLD